jgi:hypothetical protein
MYNFKIISGVVTGISLTAFPVNAFSTVISRHYLRVHVRTAFIIDTVQDGEQQYEKLSSHVQDVLQMLIALSRRVLHKESRLASLRTGGEQVLCLLSASGINYK